MSADTAPHARHLGGGHGEITLPPGMAQEHPGWVLRRFWWTGSEYWYVSRTHPVPAEAAARGVVEQWRGWSDEPRMRTWLHGQTQAWDAYLASA